MGDGVMGEEMMMKHVNRCIIISTKRGKIKGKERKGKKRQN